MVWVRYSDDFMLDERVQVIDCCADSALRAAYEVCGRTETDGVFYLDQLMTRWSPAKGNRRRLRKAIHDLIEIDLLRRLEYDEVLRRYTMAVEKGHQFGLRPVKNRHYFEIIDYLKWQFSADRKQAEREKNRQYVAEHRQRKQDEQDAAVSPLRKATPDPVPDPELKINDHAKASEEGGPATANPSTPSNGATDQDAGSWLRGEWTRRQQKQSKPRKWKQEYQPHVDSIVQQARQEPGEPFDAMNAAMDSFFADAGQDRYGHVPSGLAYKWDHYVADYRERAEAEARERRIAEKDAEYHRMKAEYEARAELERKQKHRQNGHDGPMAEAVAELMRSIAAKVD